jgi:phage shock protein C
MQHTTADDRQNLFTRDDTFFGVCEALGEDLRFNANWLRAALGVLLLWNPAAVLGTYAALGAVVLVTRLVAPNPRKPAAAARLEAPQAEAAQPQAQEEPVALAA